MEVQQSSYSLLPIDPGVYVFQGVAKEVLYVGKANNLKKRVSSYFSNKEKDYKTKVLVSQIKFIRTISVNSELEALILEANLIKKHQPKYNMRLTDGKNYVQIRIVNNDKYPKILLSRNNNDSKSVYFGPFPNTTEVKLVLKLIRKIFPYQSVMNHPKRYCLYYHLKLCPCPPMFKTEEENKNYKKDINYIIKFFEGKTSALLKELEKERGIESKKENFEKANEYQLKINAIKQITTNFHKPFEFEKNPNLRKSLRKKEISDLINVLNNNGIVVKNLNRIECYDISNISGKNATGSMVVFVDGEKDSNSYRRFKIKNPPKVIPNDYAMMQEVIKRRLKHTEWSTPDLIIVDGGKGQVSSAKKVLENQNEAIPLIGIAKREELLITENFDIIRLNKNSPAIILVRRIRDEAHRFAITYHKKLRSKFIPNI